MPDCLEFIAGRIPADHRELITHLGGEDGASAGLRVTVAAGLAALSGDGAHLLTAVDDLAALADRLGTIAGRRTPSGSWWAPSDQAMPDPERLHPAGDVVAAPTKVVIAGPDGAVMIDAAARQISAQDAAGQAHQAVELGDIAAIGACLTGGLVTLSTRGPGRVALGDGFIVERRDDGMARLSLRGVGCSCSMLSLWKFAAELVSLTASEVAEAIDVREALEARLAEAGR
jgi:hypothetical protein